MWRISSQNHRLARVLKRFSQALEGKLFSGESILLKRTIASVVDFFVFMGSLYASYLLYLNFKKFNLDFSTNIQIILLSLASYAAFRLSRLHRIIWRYIGFGDVFKLGVFCVTAVAILGSFRIAFLDGFKLLQLPWAVLINNAVLSFSGLVSIRVFRRWLSEGGSRENKPNKKENKRAILVGAGRLGFKVISELQSLGSIAPFSVQGFVDDSDDKIGRNLGGVPVLGHSGDLYMLVKNLDIQRIIITISEPDGEIIKQLTKLCEQLELKLLVTPSYQNLLSGKLAINQIRDVKIEDLLGRRPIKLNDPKVISFIRNKVIVITGAGGSIGSELVRQIAKQLPEKLVLLERSEPALYQIHREFAGKGISNLVPIVADVCDEQHLRRIFQKHRPKVVFHAAAHKHVPLMEENIYAAAKNNIFGTTLLSKVSGEFGVENFVLISTDKAVRPTSIMGMSKQFAEREISAANLKYATNFSAVRFGNVLGSSGSVIPLFKEQIKHGGPVTITDKQMTRYFMTIPEACQLVIQAGSMGEGGEVFVLDMGEPIKIVDLARDMIRLSGYIPEQDIEIKVTGIRPGEKLYEELHHDYSKLKKTKHPLIFHTDIEHEPLSTSVVFRNLISQITGSGLSVSLENSNELQSNIFNL